MLVIHKILLVNLGTVVLELERLYSQHNIGFVAKTLFFCNGVYARCHASVAGIWLLFCPSRRRSKIRPILEDRWKYLRTLGH